MPVRPKAPSVQRWPLFGLSLLPLMLATVAYAAGPVLPTGGTVTAGSAIIGAPSNGAVNISQSSNKAIIDWSSFSIGQNGAVQFNNGSGATLNRVTGLSVSSIDGLLSATGSVYLINANGVIIGKTGVVNVGGTFAASTLDVDNAVFMAGGDLTFAGLGNAEVINLGKVGALGGDVALIAAKVENDGDISAPNGTAALISGYQVLMRDASLDDGKFSVLVGGVDTSVANGGTIAAANAELRAEGGSVYALAGNTAGVVRATGVKSGDGRIWLMAEGGALDVAGTLEARGANGGKGQIETSGGHVTVGSASINAHGGSWLVDPYDLTIDAAAATTIDGALNAGTNVAEVTAASGYGGAGVANAAGSGDIIVAAPIAWSTNANLTLSAYRNVAVNSGVTLSSTGGGGLILYADNTGTGTGTVNFGTGAGVSTSGFVNLFYNPASNPTGSVLNITSYTSPTDYSANVSGGAVLTALMLVNSIYDLQNIQNNLTGNYALNRDIDASVASGWTSTNFTGFTPIGGGATPNSFSGIFEGSNHTISGLSETAVSGGGASTMGLFGRVTNGAIRNLNLINANITSSSNGEEISAGVLIGINDRALVSNPGGATISNIHVYDSSVFVAGANYVGGLIGDNAGGLYNLSLNNTNVRGSIFTAFNVSNSIGGLIGVNSGAIRSAIVTGGTVTAGSNNNSNGGVVGGLIGANSGSITQASSSATISASYETYAGGLIGYNKGAVSDVYATGAVTDTADQFYGFRTVMPDVGGLIGFNVGSVNNAYALGAVSNTGVGGTDTGGFVGVNNGASISNAYSTGKVTVTGGGAAGGFAGANGAGSITNAYWDVLTSGQVSGVNNSSAGSISAVIGVAGTGAYSQSTYANFDFTNTWFIIPGETRPILRSEYSTTITNAHQLQLMEMNLGASYTLGANIDLTEANGSNPSGLWSPAGFSPIGDNSAGSGPLTQPFSGSLNGQGYTIANLTITVSQHQNQYPDFSGMFGFIDTGATVKNFALTNVAIDGALFSGALAAWNSGQVSGVTSSGNVWGSGAASVTNIGGLIGDNFATGSVTNASSSAYVASSYPVNTTLSSTVGGLVGTNYGTISNAFTTGQVVMGPNAYAGGIAGINSGAISTSYTTSALLGQVGATPTAVGQLVARNSGTLTYSYWLDYGVPGVGVNMGATTGNSPLTGSQSVQSSSYGFFDFGMVWLAHDGVTQPTLRHATSGN